ncbi:Hypothetical_protein [Hexamita inflata]|uniref:Hypothetical_protein n=1 Tax=Hexamita inflata TaxID=28002 RepID=A0AA86QB92_9EUKA|nr:Hypothetical protein HINF_LOCUS37402 [Hexamita inflata]
MLCSGFNGVFNSMCYFNNSQHVYSSPLADGSSYKFQNELLIQYREGQITPNQEKTQTMSSGLAAGISVAVCVVVFSITYVTMFAVYKKKNSSKSIRSKQTKASSKIQLTF